MRKEPPRALRITCRGCGAPVDERCVSGAFCRVRLNDSFVLALFKNRERRKAAKP